MINVRLKPELGFTVIEMLVVVMIMAILTTSILTNYSGLNRSRDLKAARNNLVSDLHTVQSYSLSNRDVVAGTSASAYGVEFNPTSTPGSYNVVGYDNSLSPVRTLLYSFNLPKDVYIQSVTVTNSSGTTVNTNTLSILFTVPYGRVQQTYSGATSATNERDDTTTVTLSTSDGALTLPVVINGITGNIIGQ